MISLKLFTCNNILSISTASIESVITTFVFTIFMFSKELKWEGWVSCDHFWLNHVTDKNWTRQSDSAFLFGGNPGNEDHQDDRLDDFWQLCLNDESRNKILEQCKIHLLKCKFYDLKTSRPTDAIAFLRSKEVSISWLCIIKFLINGKNLVKLLITPYQPSSWFPRPLVARNFRNFCCRPTL